MDDDGVIRNYNHKMIIKGDGPFLDLPPQEHTSG